MHKHSEKSEHATRFQNSLLVILIKNVKYILIKNIKNQLMVFILKRLFQYLSFFLVSIICIDELLGVDDAGLLLVSLVKDLCLSPILK